MSYRELAMIDVREVLRRWAAGQRDRQLDRETGVDRKTVARYRAIAEELGLPRDRALTDDEVHEVAQRIQARALPDRSAEWEEAAGHKERIKGWLEQKRPLRLKKIHVLLKRDHNLEAGYSTLRRDAIQQLGWHKKAGTVLLEDPPAGQVAIATLRHPFATYSCALRGSGQLSALGGAVEPLLERVLRAEVLQLLC